MNSFSASGDGSVLHHGCGLQVGHFRQDRCAFGQPWMPGWEDGMMGQTRAGQAKESLHSWGMNDTVRDPFAHLPPSILPYVARVFLLGWL